MTDHLTAFRRCPQPFLRAELPEVKREQSPHRVFPLSGLPQGSQPACGRTRPPASPLDQPVYGCAERGNRDDEREKRQQPIAGDQP